MNFKLLLQVITGITITNVLSCVYVWDIYLKYKSVDLSPEKEDFSEMTLTSVRLCRVLFFVFSVLLLSASALRSSPAFLIIPQAAKIPRGLRDSCQHHLYVCVECRHWSSDQFNLICWHDLEAVLLLKNKERENYPEKRLPMVMWQHASCEETCGQLEGKKEREGNWGQDVE